MPLLEKSWLTHIEDDIISLATNSSLGKSPDFPMEKIVQGLSDKFNLNTIKITTSEWKSKDHLFQGFDETPLITPLSLSPLPHNIFWIMNKSDVSLLLKGQIKEAKLQIEHPDIIKGFYRYILLNTIQIINKCNLYKDATLKLCDTSIATENCYAIDINITTKDNSLWGRLLLPSSFEKALESHMFTQKCSLQSLNTKPNLYLPLTLSAGETTLSQKELLSLQPGDFILTNNCTLDPNTQKGTFKILLGSKPIIQAKTREHAIKILDYIYFVEEKTMDTPPLDNFDDLEKKPILDDFSSDDKLLDDFSEPLDEEKKEAPTTTASSSIESPLEKIKATDVPVKIHLELSRIQMTLEELQKLSPGSVVPIQINTNNIELTVEGKSIGQGELAKLGDTTGIKILKLY